MISSPLNTAQVEEIAKHNPVLLREYLRIMSTPLARFQPRENDPENFDEQRAFVESKAKFSICLGGNRSGKTIAAAYKTARYVLNTPPMRDNCPFWIVGDSFDQVCATCWDEKLSKFIPENHIKAIDYYRPNRNWPFAVILKHPNDISKSRAEARPGWVLEFKSYVQGRRLMQARSIGGYWFNEECPLDIVYEVQTRALDYQAPGWADFTPVEIVSPEWPDLFENPHPGWEFFQLNVRCNSTLDAQSVEDWLKSFPEDERLTREVGAFASFKGQVFKEFRKSIHVIGSDVGPEDMRQLAGELERGRISPEWTRIRGIDFGFNNPFCCVWVAKDRDERYYVYDEYFDDRCLNAYRAEQIKKRDWRNTPSYGPTYTDHDAQSRAELGALGIPCTPANKRDVRERISHLRRLMMSGNDGRPRLYILSKCENLIREIRSYHWPDDVASEGNRRGPADLPVDKDNHAIDAMGYAIWSHATSDNAGAMSVRRRPAPRAGVQLAMSAYTNGRSNGHANGHANGNGKH